MKWYLAAIPVLLFCTGYWICNLLFINGSTEWWGLRIAIFTVIFACVFYIGFKLNKGFTRAIFLVGIVFCGGDILDRYVFNIQSFQLNDLLLYVFAIYYLRKIYAREVQTNS